jgi:DNA-binding XRE family transcriptional regulator
MAAASRRGARRPPRSATVVRRLPARRSATGPTVERRDRHGASVGFRDPCWGASSHASCWREADASTTVRVLPLPQSRPARGQGRRRGPTVADIGVRPPDAPLGRYGSTATCCGLRQRHPVSLSRAPPHARRAHRCRASFPHEGELLDQDGRARQPNEARAARAPAHLAFGRERAPLGQQGGLAVEGPREPTKAGPAGARRSSTRRATSQLVLPTVGDSSATSDGDTRPDILVAMDAAWLLRTARAQAGLSQRALAEAAGTSQSAVAAIESGRKQPTVATLERLL